MKNKLLFKIVRFLRKLGLKPEDIALDLNDQEAMVNLAQSIFGSVLSLPDSEEEYYEIVCDLYGCELEEAEEKEIGEIVPVIIKSLKGNSNFSIGVLKNMK